MYVKQLNYITELIRRAKPLQYTVSTLCTAAWHFVIGVPLSSTPLCNISFGALWVDSLSLSDHWGIPPCAIYISALLHVVMKVVRFVLTQCQPRALGVS